jgi:hypothetical protein
MRSGGRPMAKEGRVKNRVPSASPPSMRHDGFCTGARLSIRFLGFRYDFSHDWEAVSEVFRFRSGGVVGQKAAVGYMTAWKISGVGSILTLNASAGQYSTQR